MQESVVAALKESEIRNAGVLIVGKTEELPDLPNVFISQTESHEIMEDVDCLLERCAFEILKQVHLYLTKYESHNAVSERERNNLQDVYEMIKSSFKRSSIPMDEWPDIPTENFEYPETIDKAVADILDTPAIIGCVKTRGLLQIYIQSSADSTIEENVRRELKKHGVTGCHFLRRSAQQLCTSGDSAFGGRGTIGGFVKKVNLTTVSVTDSTVELTARADKLVALVSRHVAQEQLLLTVDNIQQPIGRIAPIISDGTIDILPVDVYDECRSLCDTKFRTELSVRMMVTKLRRIEEIQELRGAPVHIWGARSNPGLGVFVRHDLSNLHGLRIIVRDRERGLPFAQAGDSGAMVCYYNSRYGGRLYAVAMVVDTMWPEDEQSDREYTAQILDDALQKLSIMNGCEFVFIEDDNN